MSFKKKLQRAIEISKALKPKYQSGQHFHTSFAFQRSKIISIAWNNYDLEHLHHKYGQYKPTRDKDAKYKASRHSEICLLQKLILPPQDLVLINVKIDNNNQPSLAKPCDNCIKVVDGLFKRIYFTIDEQTYGTI